MQSLGNRELWPRFDACWSEVEEAKANLDFGILSVLQVTSIVWFDFSPSPHCHKSGSSSLLMIRLATG
jgi:hypothetical protein